MPARGRGRGKGRGKSGKSSAKGEGAEQVVDDPSVEVEPSDATVEDEQALTAYEVDDKKSVSSDLNASAVNNDNESAPASAEVTDAAPNEEQLPSQPNASDADQSQSEHEPSTVPKPAPESDQTQSQQESSDSTDDKDDLSKLNHQGITGAVANEILNLIKAGKFSLSDLSDDLVLCLKDYPADKIVNAVTEFSEADTAEISDRASHLQSILKAWQDDKLAESSPSGGPNEAKIKALLERTGYNHEVSTGQRHYGPPSDWQGGPPGHDTEIFVGKVPWDVYEDELVPLFEEFGKLYEIRIMINPANGTNRGFAFVRYVSKESVKLALEKLNDYEIRPGKKIKLNESNPKKRLFVGNVPKTKSKEEIMEEFSKHTENLTDVIIYVNPDDVGTERKNRGFCFLDYASHPDAAEAKKIIGKKGFRAFDSDTFVDWADRIEENDDSVMSEVKNLYVRHLSSDVTEDMLKEKFGEFGALEKVKRIKDYAFIHFVEREHALKAMEAMNNYSGLGKCALEVTLARPVTDKVKQKREQKKWEHQVQRMQRLGGLGIGAAGGGIGAAIGGGQVGVGAAGSAWAWPPHAPAAHYAAYDYAYTRPMHHPFGWDYAQQWAARPHQFGSAYRGRGIGYPRGFPAYGYGYGYGYGAHRGHAFTQRGYGGQAGARAGARKRKAQEPLDNSNGAKRPVQQQQQQQQQQHDGAATGVEEAAPAAATAEAAAAVEQDWTSDVTATW